MKKRMKRDLSKISGYLQIEKLRNDKRVVVFSVCLLIATTLWFLNALSKEYTTTLAYPVKFIEAPAGRFIANKLPTKLELNVDAHGFTLLRHKFSLSLTPIILNISSLIKNVEESPNGYRINSNKLSRLVSNQISNEITLKGIQPEVFFIKLDSLKTKTVSVKPNIDLAFSPQYHLKEQVILSPSKVEITGPAAILDTIFSLTTESKTFEELESTVNTTLKIIHPEKTMLKTQFANLKIPVEKFTEKEMTIPIRIINKPENVKMKLFPSEIKLTVLVGLSEFENINASAFDVFVDYSNIKAETKDLKVIVNSNLQETRISRFSPVNVEFLIETN